MGCGGSKPVNVAVVSVDTVDGKGRKSSFWYYHEALERFESFGDGSNKDYDEDGKSFDEIYALKRKRCSSSACDSMVNTENNRAIRVQEGYHIESGESFAIKIVRKNRLSKEDYQSLQNEISVLQRLHHRHVIRLYGVFEENYYTYLIMEKMMGGELFDQIVTKQNYTEQEARQICKKLFEAVEYCHYRQVAHRDLKPENILLKHPDSYRPQMGYQNDNIIKLSGFRFAKLCTSPQSLRTQCGTPDYVAPEIVDRKPYGTQVDMWSLGVIVYVLLGGYPPFMINNHKFSRNETPKDLFQKIRNGEYEFHSTYWDNISDDAKDMISSLLTVDPNQRWTATRILKESPWMISHDNDSTLNNAHNLRHNFRKLKSYHAKRKVKAAVTTIVAIHKATALLECISNEGKSNECKSNE